MDLASSYRKQIKEMSDKELESDLKKIYDFIKNQLDFKEKLYLTARPYPTIINLDSEVILLRVSL